uniref:Uncharacterized protein n=1 Tax=Glossina brevipalpis TaxID=37001 RepID=A0A1A9WLZ5_9MUSC
MVSLTDCETSSLSNELFRKRGWLHLSSIPPLTRDCCSLFRSLYSAAIRLISLKAINVVCVLHGLVCGDLFFIVLDVFDICQEDFSGERRKVESELLSSLDRVEYVETLLDGQVLQQIIFKGSSMVFLIIPVASATLLVHSVALLFFVRSIVLVHSTYTTIEMTSVFLFSGKKILM